MATIFAFKPTAADEDFLDTSYTVYDPELDNPYEVDDGDAKIRTAIDALPDPVETYEADGDDEWVRFEYDTLVDVDAEEARLS